ncbi:MAG: hypothetical protein K6T78_04175 [Alicyclobacillus sp.]|nr:hypothetical protein [Alicyclobacillus sp.]
MSFRGEFIRQINDYYRDAAARHKSIETDWRRIQGYLRTFMEEIQEVRQFACANTAESESELVLSVEGHELAFRRRDDCIQVLTDGNHRDYLFPTVEGFCANYEDKKLLEMLDVYMRDAFARALRDLSS